MNVLLISSWIGLFVLTILCFALAISNKRLRNRIKTQDEIELSAYLQKEPEDILKQVEAIMDLEVSFAIELPYEGKDIKRITDFEDTLKELTTNTSKALNQNFFDKAEALGYDTDYILEYITRGCTVRILKYIQDNNAGYTTGNEEEAEE